jgi:glycosyltransferase involved in cell wall biosynthesis
MTVPLLSAVIPVWNRPRVLWDAIDSALAQGAEGEIEVIVVDDASTDDTVAGVERRYGSRVRLLRSPYRRGPGAARNAGARVATGELLAFLDSDDVWLPGKLNAELRVLEEFDGADAVVSDDLGFLEGVAEPFSRFAYNGLLEATGGKPRWQHECRYLWTNSCNGVATGSMTVRRSAAARIGPVPFAEDIDSFEDWEFEIRLYDRCRVVMLPEVWSWVRRFDDGTRTGRAVPGKPLTRDQELRFQRNRLTVLDRAQWQKSLDEYLIVELERCRAEAANDLARGAME